MKHLFGILSLLFSLSAGILQAQHNGGEHDGHHIKTVKKDSTCLKDCIAKAHWSAHSRTFLMATYNEGSLKDDYALATGAGISMETKPVYGFQVGISGFFIYNLLSSDIHKTDPYTNMPNRYETGLFDIENHENRNDLDRLEELFLKYSRSKSSITIGKMILNTPFINPQDGRMRPTISEGVWMQVAESERFGFNGGWIWDVSPRSTVKWYSVANSFGVYPSGVDAEGRKSAYAGQIQGNSGIAITNLYFRPFKGVRMDVWNGMLENIMNTAMLEISNEHKTGHLTYYQGFMFMRQDAINNGGNADPLLTYVDKGARSNIFSFQTGIKNKKFNSALAYTRITSEGRYLMPREWGREVFYTFMPRERAEGLGDVHHVTVRTSFNLTERMQTGLAYGYARLPDVNNYRLNKYGMPSYHHINYHLNYNFKGFLNGMEMKLLVAAKIKQGETYGNLKYVYNKVNMLNLNLVLDFKL